MVQGFLRRTHLSTPGDVAMIVAEEAATHLGARDVDVYLVDYELTTLVPLPVTGRPETREPLPVTGTIAGRTFATTAIVDVPAGATGTRRWIPLLDGTDRMGVLGMTFDEAPLPDGLELLCERYAHLVASTLMTKRAYGDAIERARRQQTMTIASELLWSLVPPLMFATDDVTLAGMLEPAYDNGGDALDYAVNGRTLHMCVFDAMGHGLAAAGGAAFALAAYRHSRRRELDLEATYAAMDHAVGTEFPDRRFVTALIAELDLDSGRLEWISAGHPPPLLVRDTRHTRVLPTDPLPPLGVALPRGPVVVHRAALEPGDLLLLYTDGLTEARTVDGELLTLEHLSDFIAREASAGAVAPETLRRLRDAILRRERAELRDDATALLVEWRRGSEWKVLPQTVAE